jgi:hypothetical protein
MIAALPHQHRMPAAEPQIRLVLVVGSAPHLNIPNSGRASIRKWHDMMELQTAAFRASPVRSHERALPPVSIPHGTSHRGGMCRDLPVAPRSSRGRDTWASFVRSRCSSSIVRARSKTIPTSPLGIECRIRSCTRRSFSNVVRVTVNCTF